MSLFPKLTKEPVDIEEKLEQVLTKLNKIETELEKINKTLHEAESRQFVVKLTK